MILMETKVIKTEQQYHEYLKEVHSLLSIAPKLGTAESDRLELLTVLLESYEHQKYPVELPDPIDAIQFRMQEKGLKQADLVPYFGTKSRVSEILSRTRPLTVPMIRALTVGLGISAETLIGSSEESEKKSNNGIDWSRFPSKEMISRGWISKIAGKNKAVIEEKVKEFISQIEWQVGEAAFRRSLLGDAYSPTTKYALYAWLARVVQKSRTQRPTLGTFNDEILSSSFIKELAQLSWFDDGPKRAIKFLQENGIAVVIEPHLKGTMLDGAALKDVDGSPIIGLTLRYDRLDNFWFTLVHEMVHIWKHVGKEEMFLDDLKASSTDRREAEANRFAREAFIPRVVWKRSEVRVAPNKGNIDALSRELKIHPSIIAGRIRREHENHRLFTDLVEHGRVKELLTDSTIE